MGKLDLRDKTVVITGASGGIGSEAAVAFARRGAKVVLSGRNMQALEYAAERVRELGKEAHVAPADVRIYDDVKGVVQQALELTGGLHVMMLGAGYGVLGDIDKLTLEMWHQQMDVNFWGVLHGFYASLPHFIEQGFGRYIIINSLSGRLATPLNAPYCASKFALCGFTDSVRAELAGKNIGMLSVYPYFVKTPFQANIKGPGLDVPHDLAWKMRGQSPARLAERIVRACEKNKGEIISSAFGKVGTRIAPLSFNMAEWTRRLIMPMTRGMLGLK